MRPQRNDVREIKINSEEEEEVEKANQILMMIMTV